MLSNPPQPHKVPLGADELMRFSVAMPESMLMDFDQLVARRGLAKNRSEVIRDLVRDALLETHAESSPEQEVMGTLTIVYDHHASDLQNKLHFIQHEHHEAIVSTMHVHMDHAICLEVIVLRGPGALVYDLANMISGTKGVLSGKLVCVPTNLGAA